METASPSAISVDSSTEAGQTAFVTTETVQYEGDNTQVEATEGETRVSANMPSHIIDTADSAPPTRRDLGRLEQTLVAEMQHLREEFITKIRYDALKDEQIRSLSKEIHEAREGLYQRMLHPLYMRLIDLYDDMSKILMSISRDTGRETGADIDNLRGFLEMVEQILIDQGVERYQLEGDDFIAERQRVIKVVNTNDAALDKKVVEHLRSGFLYAGKILRPEWVNLYRLIPEPSLSS